MTFPLRIVRFSRTVTPVPGGKEIHVSELSSRQAARGHSVDLYAERGDAPSGTALHRISAVPPWVPGSAAQAFWFSRACATSISRSGTRPDVLHAHGDVGEAWALRRLARSLAAPSVLTVHARLSPRWRRLATRVFPGLDRIMAVSEPIVDDLVACGVERARCLVISSGLNYDLLGPYLGRPVGGDDLITVGTLNAMKNHVALIDALPIVRFAHPATRLTIVGDGPLRSRLEAQAARVGGIRFAGRLPRPDVYDLVSAAGIFVLPSRSEGTATALLEAMALGRPCVVGPEAAPRGALAANVVVAPSATPEGLASAIVRLMEDDGAAIRLAAGAAEAARAYDWERCVDRVGDAYDELLSRSR